jgi:flagellar basal-body rod protein FlgG
MTRGIYTVASGGVAALERLQAVSQNLANVNTAGYRAERIVFQVQPLAGGPRGAIDSVLGRTSQQVVAAETVRDFSPGPIHETGNPLDVALSGDGFFVVNTARGERYTRQGSFSLDGQGYLVTARGDRVQGDGGDINIGEHDIRIGEDGSIFADDQPVGRLKVVGFGDKPALVPEGDALFAPANPQVTPTTLDTAQVQIAQAHLEGANVNAVAGLEELVEVQRGYESYMHALKRLDELVGRSINEVGRV